MLDVNISDSSNNNDAPSVHQQCAALLKAALKKAMEDPEAVLEASDRSAMVAQIVELSCIHTLARKRTAEIKNG